MDWRTICYIVGVLGIGFWLAFTQIEKRRKRKAKKAFREQKENA